MMHLDSVGVTQSGAPFTWSREDSLLYSLSVGANPQSQRELQFVTEGFGDEQQLVLPTFAVILTMKSGASSIRFAGDFPLSAVIHAGQKIVTSAAIPPEGSGVGTSQVQAIYDTGKHAIVTSSTEIADSETGEVIVQTETTALIRGAGNFGGPPPPPPISVPGRLHDGEFTERTLPQQALLYRLNGDMNPLHADQGTATRAGFPAPILHGLCTYGFSGRALLLRALDGNLDAFREFESRFTAPVYPGEELTTRWWDEGDHLLFRCLVGERVVLDGGVLRRQ